QDGASGCPDLRGVRVPVVDLDAPVVDAGPRTGQLRFLDVLAVVDHQREVDVAVRHVPGDVAARAAGRSLAKAEDVLVEARGLLEVVALDGDVSDPRHVVLLGFRSPRGAGPQPRDLLRLALPRSGPPRAEDLRRVLAQARRASRQRRTLAVERYRQPD